MFVLENKDLFIQIPIRLPKHSIFKGKTNFEDEFSNSLLNEKIRYWPFAKPHTKWINEKGLDFLNFSSFRRRKSSEECLG